MTTTDQPDAHAEFWARLTARFPDEQVEKLPKVLSREDRNKGRCQQGSTYSADGHHCGGWHARAVHLDYIGHAGITMRLNDVCGPDGWDWEPLVSDENGFPAMPRGEFWIVLKIRRPDGEWVTKKGVGDDFNGSSKQAIGDALRNAAMRFGIATYLWSKADSATTAAENTPPDRTPEATDLWARAQAATVFDQIKALWSEANARGLLEVEITNMDDTTEPLGAALKRHGDHMQGTGA